MIAPTALLALALAQAAPSPGGYSGLFTRWSGTNEEAMRAERQPAAPAAPSGPLRAGSPELGERVGEMVRLGDCEGGERAARAAGDFPLVEAVRTHCRAVPAMSRR